MDGDVDAIDGAPNWSAALFLLTLPLILFVGTQRRLLRELQFEALGLMTAAMVLSAALPYSLLLVTLVLLNFLAFSLATVWILRRRREPR